MRFITAILLICVFFFLGMVFGMYDKPADPAFLANGEDEVMQMEPYHEEVVELEASMPLDEDLPFVHKVADKGEAAVTSIYESIVEFLYMLADLFF